MKTFVIVKRSTYFLSTFIQHPLADIFVSFSSFCAKKFANDATDSPTTIYIYFVSTKYNRTNVFPSPIPRKDHYTMQQHVFSVFYCCRKFSPFSED